MQDEESPFIETTLSRSSYRVGESVVGTIRLVPSNKSKITATTASSAQSPSNNNDSLPSPRDVFSNTFVFVAGWCRLDPRWHRAPEYAKLYESPGVHFNLQNRRDNYHGNLTIDENCVCFWTTNILQLQDLQERTNGRWEHVKPKPIRGMDSDNDKDNADQETKSGDAKDNGQNNNEQSPPPLENQQLAFTFRVQLPSDLPQSVRATSCRYFYSVVVGTRVPSSSSSAKKWIRQATSIQILSKRPDQPTTPEPATTTTGRPHPPKVYTIGSISAMAHSVGLPSHVTSTQLHQPTGQILVNRRGPSSLGSLVVSASQCRQHPQAASIVASNLQTMRITDLQGKPCCVLTVMGVTTASPGSRMVLKFDFPVPTRRRKSKSAGGRRKHNTGMNRGEEASSWTPCYQVSASVEGEEVAQYVDGSKKRAQAYQLDTAHQFVDPECTEQICLQLQLPLDAPTTIMTDIVHIQMKCIIDITVGTTNHSKDADPSYSNLRLELPIRIVHPLSETEVVLSGEDVEQDEDDAYLKLPLDELILGPYYRTSPELLLDTETLRKTHDPSHPSSFVTKDIRQDLNILSLRMAQECQLI